jgi:hypothetical protein
MQALFEAEGVGGTAGVVMGGGGGVGVRGWGQPLQREVVGPDSWTPDRGAAGRGCILSEGVSFVVVGLWGVLADLPRSAPCITRNGYNLHCEH